MTKHRSPAKVLQRVMRVDLRPVSAPTLTSSPCRAALGRHDPALLDAGGPPDRVLTPLRVRGVL
jgi:hypothetical protein